MSNNNSFMRIQEMIDVRLSRTVIKPGETVNGHPIWISYELASEFGIAGLQPEDQVVVEYRIANDGEKNLIRDRAMYIKRPIPTCEELFQSLEAPNEST